MKARLYIMEAILECLPPEGACSRDLVEPVSKKTGRSISKMRITGHLRILYEEKKVHREEVILGDRVRRYRWFKNP